MLPGDMNDMMRTRRNEIDLEKASGDADVFRGTSLKRSPHSPHIRAVDWMGFIGDDVPLTRLTIPGTHDSAAYTSSVPFVRTQNMDFLDQLNEGIRYFDLRCGIRRDIVEMVHGISYLGMTLSSVLETMYLWLSVNPTEALIVQIKQDRSADHSKVDFDDAVVSMLSQRRERWRTANTVPLLGALRGRIQLFRRFGDMNAFGLNVTEWKDNPARPFTLVRGHGIRVTIQDRYTFPRPQPLPSVIKKKGGVVSRQMKLASANRDPDHWFINFTSAYELNLQYQLTPRSIAVGGYHHFKWQDGVNILLRGSLLENRGRRTRLGIVAMDFPEIGTEDLIGALIQSNFDLEEDGQCYLRLRSLLPVLLVLLILLIVFTATLHHPLWLCTTCNIGVLQATLSRSNQHMLAPAHPP